MNVLGQKQINTDSKHTQNISMQKSYLCFQAIILCYTGYKNTQKIKQNNNLGLDQTSPVLLLFLSLLSTPLLPDTKAQATPYCVYQCSVRQLHFCAGLCSSSILDSPLPTHPIPPSCRRHERQNFNWKSAGLS